VDEFTKKLAERLQFFGADVISADEVSEWPSGMLEELVKQGILTEIQHSNGLKCSECEEKCYIEPDMRTDPKSGQNTGVYICKQNSDIGRIEIDLDRLRQWQIDTEKLKELGYLKKKVKKKKRKRRISSTPTEKEAEVFRLIHIENKTPKQAAIEMRCTAQNVSKLLKKAEAKMKAQSSRSINFRSTQKLPEDNRGQSIVQDQDI
jgi:predicted DNA-binding protein (UPF0251 family)